MTLMRYFWTFACLLGLMGHIQIVHADLVDTIPTIKPAIVVVGTFSPLRNPQFQMRGTGFSIGDGSVIATNEHVIAAPLDLTQQETLAILVRHGTRLERRMVRLQTKDEDHDLALLKITGPALPALKIAPPDQTVREGQAIAFTGFPLGGALGFSPVTHHGIISSITPIVLPANHSVQLNEKSIRRIRSGAFAIYQLDATAYPGNSGGPLFNTETGEVLGILNMVFVKGTKESALEKPSGISYAIPASYLQALLSRHTD